MVASSSVDTPSTKSITKNGWPSTSPVGSSTSTSATGNPAWNSACITGTSVTASLPSSPLCSMRATILRGVPPTDASSTYIARD